MLVVFAKFRNVHGFTKFLAMNIKILAEYEITIRRKGDRDLK